MSSLGSPNSFFLAGKKAYEIERSIRNDQGTADVNNGSNFEHTYSSAGNQKTFTISVWVKKCNTPGNIGDDGYSIFSTGGGGSGAQQGNLYFYNTDTLYFVSQPQPSPNAFLITNRIFRDFSAWCHIVIKVDTTQSTASNRLKMYINGIQETSFSTETYPSQNADLQFNQAVRHRIGSNSLGSNLNHTYANFNGYIAEFNFLDGYAYDPSYFGETDAITGQWNPRKYTGSYGTNGFYLNFSDNSGTTATTLGKDSSGNGNNFTPNNYATTDAVKDSPTNNFCIMNRNDNNLSESSPHFAYSEGNLKAAWSFTGTNFDRAYGTLFVEGSDTNKYYWEATGTQNNEQMRWGVHGTHTSSYRANNRNTNGGAETDVAVMMWQPYGAAPYLMKIDANEAGVPLSTSNGNAANGDIFSFVFDGATGKFYVFFKGVEVSGQNYAAGTSVFDAVDSTKTYALLNGQGDGGTSTKNGNFILNWGQDSSFAGTKTAQGNTDANGIGDFYYSVPSGAKALCSANLPDPTIKLPNKHFDTLLWTGTSASHTLTGLNFQPDWFWAKARNQSYHHTLMDSVRGTNKQLWSNRTNDEQTNANFLTSFNSNGVTLGDNSSGTGATNTNGHPYVGWNWNAGDTDGKTYTVKVVSDSGNKYRFDNFGTSAVTLDLAEGGTYIFNMDDSSNASHPFSIGTAANGTVYASGITYFLDGVSKTYSQYTSGFYSASTRRLHITVPASAPQLYYWCSVHNGMGGAINTNTTLGSSNFDGSTQSTVKVSAISGFSIIAYEGTGSTTTVGHGLGVKPDVMIFKNRDQAHGWLVYHKEIGATKNLGLNTNSAAATASNKFNNTEPTSTVFTVSTAADSNQSGQSIICYCFSEVSSYSKFGKYTGNGLATGTFVFTGFRPALIISKKSSGTDSWQLWDNKRDPDNLMHHRLFANESAGESTSVDSSSSQLDFYSNGFKWRGSSNDTNGNGDTYIYLAFAEAPFRNTRAR